MALHAAPSDTDSEALSEKVKRQMNMPLIHESWWSRAIVDSSSVRALGGGEKTGPNPTDRAKPGSKHHLIIDGGGIPLAAILTGANTPDINELEPLVDAIPMIRGKRGHPRHRPIAVYADRAYDSEPHRR